MLYGLEGISYTEHLAREARRKLMRDKKKIDFRTRYLIADNWDPYGGGKFTVVAPDVSRFDQVFDNYSDALDYVFENDATKRFVILQYGKAVAEPPVEESDLPNDIRKLAQLYFIDMPKNMVDRYRLYYLKNKKMQELIFAELSDAEAFAKRHNLKQYLIKWNNKTVYITPEPDFAPFQRTYKTNFKVA